MNLKDKATQLAKDKVKSTTTATKEKLKNIDMEGIIDNANQKINDYMEYKEEKEKEQFIAPNEGSVLVLSCNEYKDSTILINQKNIFSKQVYSNVNEVKYDVFVKYTHLKKKVTIKQNGKKIGSIKKRAKRKWLFFLDYYLYTVVSSELPVIKIKEKIKATKKTVYYSNYKGFYAKSNFPKLGYTLYNDDNECIAKINTNNFLKEDIICFNKKYELVSLIFALTILFSREEVFENNDGQ
ncbi:MAG: hypothetical protein PHH04_02130 [Thomasclavelia sp.]|nr:hypothetical protein [Thomasclavelia sp.]